MGLFANFDISGSAISAQSHRLNTVASNLANAQTLVGDAADAYRARHPVFQTMLANPDHPGESGVNMLGIVESAKPIERRYDPGHALANAEGYVFGSNVNSVEEMANMISASRSYQNNVEVLNTSRDLLMRMLQLGN